MGKLDLGVYDAADAWRSGQVKQTSRWGRGARGQASEASPKTRRKARRNGFVDRVIGHRRPSLTRCPREENRHVQTPAMVAAVRSPDAVKTRRAVGRHTAGNV